MGFRINNQDKMRLTTDGKFGIGTTSPTSLLTVAGDVSFQGDLDVEDNLTVSGSIISYSYRKTFKSINIIFCKCSSWSNWRLYK